MTGRSDGPGDLGPGGWPADSPYGPGQLGPPPGEPYGQTTPHRGVNRLAIAALVVGIIIPIIGGIPALLLGYTARFQIRSKNQAGRGLAIAAIIIGWLSVAYIVALIVALVVGVASSPEF